MHPMILGLGGPEVVLIAVLALLLFGGKKIPELMNGIGKGVKSFRDGMAGVAEDTTAKEEGKPAEAPKQEKVEEKPAEGQK